MKMKALLAAPVAALAMVGGVLAAPDVTATNKRLVIDFFNFNGTRAQRAEQMLTPDYVQHNPRFLVWGEQMGLTGAEAWTKVLPDATAKRVRLVDLGGISLRRPVIVMVENGLVHAVYKGRLPDPAQPEKTYEAFAFEAFRIRDGRFSEHWDQVRLTPGWMTPSPTPLAAGQADSGPAPVPQPPATCTATAAELAANKKLVMGFFEGGAPTAANVRTKAATLAVDYIQHNPRFVKLNERFGASGRAGFIKAIESGALAPAAAPAPRTADLVIADCDYVAVVWKQTTPDPDRAGRNYEAFTFDTFRIANGLIAEHWDGATP